MVAGVAGAAVSSVAITTPSVWFDEAATVSGATRSISELLHMLDKVDAVHGLYYMLMHVVFGAAGYTPLSLRLVSAFAVGATAAVVVVLDRQLRPGSMGIVASSVFCVLPRVTWMGGEGRSFALTALVAGILTIALLFALRRKTVLPWVLYAVVAVVALVPFVLVVVKQGSQLPSMPELDAGAVRGVLVEQWFGSSVPLTIVAGVLLALGVRDGWLALPALGVPTLAVLAGGLVHPELHQSRYLGMVTIHPAPVSIADAVPHLPHPRSRSRHFGPDVFSAPLDERLHLCPALEDPGGRRGERQLLDRRKVLESQQFDLGMLSVVTARRRLQRWPGNLESVAGQFRHDVMKRRCRTQPPRIYCDAGTFELVAAGFIEAATHLEPLQGEAQVDAPDRPGPHARVGAVRLLVRAEAHVTVRPRDAAAAVLLLGRSQQILHGLADAALVFVPVRLEERFRVVALQARKEPQRGGIEALKGHHGTVRRDYSASRSVGPSSESSECSSYTGVTSRGSEPSGPA